MLETNCGAEVIICTSFEWKYYPDGAFMDLDPTRSCYFTLRNLMYGKRLLECGILCRVGDGENIREVKDRWDRSQPRIPSSAAPSMSGGTHGEFVSSILPRSQTSHGFLPGKAPGSPALVDFGLGLFN